MLSLVAMMRALFPPLEGADHPNCSLCASRVGHALPLFLCDSNLATVEGGRHYVTLQRLPEVTATCGLAACRQRMMNDVLRDFLNKVATVVYLDDVCVSGRTLEEHLERMRFVF
jgi:hypothetical protein